MKQTISERCWNQGHSWHYQHILNVDGVKIKVQFCRNAYDFQSHAKTYIWSPTENKWNLVVSSPIDMYDFKSISYVNKNITAKDFRKDCQTILDETLAVCSVL